MGIYPISFICYMLGELPSEIKSMTRFSDKGVDEIESYLFRFPSGALCTINTSFNLKIDFLTTLYGTKGYIKYPDFQEGEKIYLHIHNGTNEEDPTEKITVPNYENGFIYQVEEVVRCIREGRLESDIISLDETIGIMKMMDKMRAEWGFNYDFEK